MSTPTLSLLLVMAIVGAARAEPEGSLQEPSGPSASAAAAPLSVEEAVSQALAANPSLSAARREALAARSGVRAARALANPEIAFVPGITPFGSDEELLIRQPLELNGARSARAGVAEARLRAALAQAVTRLREVVFSVKTAYYTAARARERLALAREALRLAEELDRIAHRQVELGARPGIEATQTGIEVTRARQQVALAEADAAVALAALNTLRGRKPDEPVGPLSLAVPPAQTPPMADLLPRALSARAEIAEEAAVAEGFRQEARLARAEGRPDLAPQVRATRVTRGISETGIGLAITLPLLDHGSRRHRIRQAQESARAQADRLAAVRLEVWQEAEQALARVRAAESVLREYPKGLLDRARRLLEASRVGFQEGQTGIIAVLEAQRTFRSVQAEYADAQADYALALAELERATGAVPESALSEIGGSR